MTSLALKFVLKLPILKIRKIWSNFERSYLENQDEIEKTKGDKMEFFMSAIERRFQI